MSNNLIVNKAKIRGNRKTTLSILALLLTLTMTLPLAAIESANAHSPRWTIVSYAYIVAAPNPVGVGQTLAVSMWVDTPLPGDLINNDIRRHDYKLTITKPDGTNETKNFAVVGDPTGFQYFRYTPLQAGEYTFKFDYPGQTFTWNQANTPTLTAANALFENDTFTAASSITTITVQQAQLPLPLDSYPLPAEYWTRPIEGQNTYWYSIASNWLGTPYILGAASSFGIPGAYQPDGAAPNTDHVMWTKPIQYGGVVGGTRTAVLGEMYYQGGSYNVRYNNPIIMQGTLFYQEPWGNAGTGGDYVAVDLRTGEELWRINTTATGINLVPSFGYLYSLESVNQHGILPNGLLIASASVSGQGTVWRGYDPRTGYLTTMNITNVPSGSNVAGPSGEYLKFVLTNLGNATNPKYNLMQWNSSNVFGKILGTGVGTWYTGTANASLPSAYDWNVSLTLPPGTWSIGTTAPGISNFPLISLNNIMLLTQGTFGGHIGDFGATVSFSPANITAVSLKPNSLGQVLWTQSYPQAPENVSRYLSAWDPSGGVFVFDDKETMTHYGYSVRDGSYLWGPTIVSSGDSSNWNYMALAQSMIAYGKLYWTGSYSGLLYAFDEQTGKLLWVYGNGGEGNSTYSGFTTPYGHFPIFISTIADGKIYLTGTEHSPNSPIYKGEKFYAINATDGTELWKISSDGNQMYGGQAPVADGYITVLNTYDCRIYSIGKGPSALTVTAPDVAVPSGTSVIIKGTVFDIATGTKQDEQAARFPHGVPAVSDASMSNWMEYVYMQKPHPTNVTGVTVQLTATDPNGNSQNIGTAISNDKGTYAIAWTPPVPGLYTVTATFAGSESYWPSSDQTYFAASAAPSPAVLPTASSVPATASPPPTQAPTLSPSPSQPPPPTQEPSTAIYIGIAAVVVIAAIVAVAVALKKRK